MSKFAVFLDSYECLVVENHSGEVVPGLMKTIYVGNNDNPASEEVVSLESLLNEFIDTQSIPTNPPSLTPEYYKLISDGLDAMVKAVEDARHRLNLMPFSE